jgi:VWFA-related protein
VALAQQPAPPPQPQQPEVTIRTTVENVVTPVLVFDHEGNYVNGLQPQQFHLYDNGKEQNIQVDVAFQPISLVIAVQANAHVEKLLPAISTIGTMISPLILGDQGEAAVIAYDSRIRTLQEFTSDPEKVTTAVKKIYPGSTSNRMVDAVAAATQMLRSRPVNRRRIILLIGETRDLGSETRGREALLDLQFANVAFYSIDMSRLLSTLTAEQPRPRPDNLPPAMYPVPPGVAATPNSVMQTFGTQGSSAQFIPLLVEIYKDAKAIFKANPVEVFTRGTGGSEFPYYSRRGLDEAIEKIGEQLHSEYMVSYSPNNKEEGGFHEIKVEVAGAPQVKRTQTRPGYWVATHQ